MKNKEFNKLLRKESPENIISQYMNGKIFLTEKQLDKCIKIKNSVPGKDHGATNFKYRKKEI